MAIVTSKKNREQTDGHASWKEITKNSYNQHASEFASFTTKFRGKLKKWIDYFANQFPNGANILDVGCGAGRDALRATEFIKESRI